MNTVHSKNLSLQSFQIQRLEKKIAKITSYLGNAYDGEASHIKAELMRKPHSKDQYQQFQCDITVYLPDKAVLRASQRSLSPEASFDLAYNKLQRQIRKLRTKRNLRTKQHIDISQLVTA